VFTFTTGNVKQFNLCAEVDLLLSYVGDRSHDEDLVGTYNEFWLILRCTIKKTNC